MGMERQRGQDPKDLEQTQEAIEDKKRNHRAGRRAGEAR